MKYAFITAALAAASLATTVNIDVEGTEVATENNRNNRHNVGRHHRGHHRGSHWWTELFSHGRNDRNDRDRNGRRGRDHGRRDRDRRADLDELLEDLFQVNFECTRNADWSRDEWKQCYRREAQEINDDLLERDDDIFGDDDDVDEESDRRDRRGRNDRNGRNGRRGRNGRNGRNDRNRHDGRREHRQMALDGGRNDGRDEEFQCRVDMNDPFRKEQIARMCCEQENLGRYNPDNQTCDIEGRDDKEDFQQCAIEQGAQDAECQRERNRN